MSFRAILNTVLGIEQAAGPVISVLVPGAAPVFAMVDPLVKRIQGSIATAEANDPRDGMGQIRGAAVVKDFEAALELAQTVAAIEGKTFIYDRDKLESAIAAQVDAFNKFAALKGSIRMVDLPKQVAA